MVKVEFQTHEKLLSGAAPDLDTTFLIFQIGDKSDLGRKALAYAVMSWRRLQRDIQPSTMIMLTFGGYDSDPRELWQIPEVRQFTQKFCLKTQAYKHPALSPASRWILLCGGDPNFPAPAWVPISKKEEIERTLQFWNDRQRKQK
jgi:hypothetical protein